MKGLRIAGGLIIIATLTGCAVQGLSLGDDSSPPPPVKQIDMAGRWKLAQPGAPSCGMHFGGGPGIHAGPIQPEGGCPDQFFTARHWELSPDGRKLTIDDFQMNILAQLKGANGGFSGTSNAGRMVTLSRYPASTTGLAPSTTTGSTWQNSNSTASPSPATPTARR
jgi:hypothetical protein